MLLRIPNDAFWVAPYIGIPYASGHENMHGADCWRLARMIWREHFGIDVPAYGDMEYEGKSEARKLADFVIAQAHDGGWRRVAGTEEVRNKAYVGVPGDGIVLRIEGHPTHIGVVICKRLFIHTMRGLESVIQEFDNLAWIDRITGIYRHASR